MSTGGGAVLKDRKSFYREGTTERTGHIDYVEQVEIIRDTSWLPQESHRGPLVGVRKKHPF